MAIWDKFRDAKRRLFDSIDALDDRAREGDVSADARRQQLENPGPRELTGGVEALEAREALLAQEIAERLSGDLSSPEEEPTEVDEEGLSDEDLEATDAVCATPVAEEVLGGVSFLQDVTELTEGAFLLEADTGGLDEPDSDEDDADRGQRFPNALNIADGLVEATLRMQHYPGVEAPSSQLHVLAHAEHELLLCAAFVGYALKQVVTEVIQDDELWCSAVLFSGMLVDGPVREALLLFEEDNSEGAARRLCWACEPFLEDVVGASLASDAHDGVGLSQAVRDLQHWLIRWRDTSVDLGLDLDLPLECTGLHRLPGFRWS